MNCAPVITPLISTSNQFILNVTLSQNAADNVGFIEHIDKLVGWNNGLLKPACYVGDAGFGNEENYEYLSKSPIDNYLKFNTFHYETTQKYKENVFLVDNMPYDPDHDTYTCPAGRKINYIGNTQRETATAYVLEAKIYECEDCSACEIASKCHNGEGNRRFSKSIKLEAYKEEARKNLHSEKGIKFRKQRGSDVETPFANIKHNMGVRRFRLRGKKKATTEMLWLAFAHNMRKVAAMSKTAWAP